MQYLITVLLCAGAIILFYCKFLIRTIITAKLNFRSYYLTQEANIEELEKKIGCGQIEEVIEQVPKTSIIPKFKILLL